MRGVLIRKSTGCSLKDDRRNECIATVILHPGSIYLVARYSKGHCLCCRGVGEVALVS